MSVNIGIVKQTVSFGTGNVTYTDASFGGGTPKAAIFIITAANADGNPALQAILGMGFTDGTNQRCAGCMSRSGQASSDCARQLMDDQSIFLMNYLGSVDGEASFVSFGTNSVTINWTNSLAGNRILTVILLGGSDLENVHVGTFITPVTIDTNVDVTDPGFEPDHVLVLSAGGNVVNNSLSDNSGASFNIGMCDNGESVVQASYNFYEGSNAATSAVNAILMNNRVLRKVFTGGAGASVELGSFDSLGFSATTRDVAGSSTCAYLALKYGETVKHSVGIADTPTSTGDEKRLFGFRPQLILQGMSTVNAENILKTKGAAGAFGIHVVCSGTQPEASNAVAMEDAQVTTDTQSLRDDTLVLPQDDGTTGLEASSSSIVGETWTQTWSNVLVSSPKFVWMAMGQVPNTAASGNLFIHGYSEIEASGDLFVHGYLDVETSGDLFIHGHLDIETSGDLFIKGHLDVETSGDLFVHGYSEIEASGDLFIRGRVQTAFNVDVVSFNASTSEGTQEIALANGFGIPDAIIITAVRGVRDGGAADHANMLVGLSDGINNRCVTTRSEHGGTKEDSDRRGDTTDVIYFMNATDGGEDGHGTVSFGTDKLTITWTTNPSVAYGVTIMVLTGLSNAWVGTHNHAYGIDGQDKANTSPGFTPDLLILASCRTGDDSTDPNGALSFGAVCNDGGAPFPQASMNLSIVNESTVGHPNMWFDDDEIMKNIYGSSVFSSLKLQSFDTDGFTTRLNDTGSMNNVFVLAIKLPSGVGVAVDSYTGKSSVGAQTFSGFGFHPYALIIAQTMSSDANITKSGSEGGSWSIGMAHDEAGISQWCDAAADEDAAGIINSESNSTSNHIIDIHENDGTEGNVAAVDSYDDDGFTLDWTTVGFGSRYGFYIAFEKQLTTIETSGDLFVHGHTPFSDNINLYIQAWEHSFYAHYIEDFRTWHIPTSGEWVEYDLSAYLPSVGRSVVAEILIANTSSDITWSGGVRTPGSVIDRRFNIRQDAAELGTDGSNSLTLHVQVSGGKIECLAENYDDIEFNLVGYWVGPHYTEASGVSIRPTFAYGWVEYDLISQGIPGGVVAEILTSTQNANGYTLGVREVGSVIIRLVPCNGGEGDGLGEKSFASTFVNTSGANGTIEGWSPHTHANRHSFIPVGYWDIPPGDYTELYSEDVANPTTNNVWEQVSVSGVPGNSVADFLFGNRKFDARQWLGLRPTDKDLERKIHTADLDSFSTWGQASNRMHVNVDANSGVVVFAENATDADDHFTCLGYWDNFTEYPEIAVESGVLYTTSHGLETGEPTLFMHGWDSINSSGQYPSGVSLYIYGVHKSPPFDLFINGFELETASGSLCIFGANIFKTDSEFSVNYPSGLSIYTKGSGIIPESGQFDLTIRGLDNHTFSGDMFVRGVDLISGSGNLFIKVVEQQTGSISLIVYNPTDVGPGLIRTPQAVFYIRDYNDTDWTHEYIEDMSIYVPGIYFYTVSMIGDPSATGTVGDGTLPLYDSLGKGFVSNQYGASLQGAQPQKQSILGRVAYDAVYPSDNADYSYPGSGSITTAFRMSGANTIASGVYDEWDNIQVGTGVRVEAGWFRREGRFNYGVGEPESTTPANTIGIEINGESGIIVRTSVRDMSFEQASGTGPYWGGTTHYGTPTGTTWSWNTEVDESYSAWNEEWPEVNIAHGDVAFFVLRSEFIASGVDGNAPNHMKVWLSVDGQPWTYIGSGLTGPPASSLYSYSDPTNRYTENAIGTKVRAINYQGGASNVGSGWVGVNELAIWTDEDKFTDRELSDLYDLISVYKRPLNEYRPTIVPPSTYIRRTVGSPIYSPIVPGDNYFGGEIGSGFLVTLEVGLGAYGEDASAYLLEEIPPSGFVIRNIQPHTDVRYTLQGTRPATQQQIFHDPQSGIMQPYNDDWGVNTYGASIRWVNHDNHPQKDERRIPTPTGIYTYELYPVSYQNLQPTSEFEFSGSGLFFDGTTGSGVFSVTTTGNTSGTTDGVLGGIKIQGFNLYMQGPIPVSGTINLYIRTQETFTSAYIGTSPRTPEATDFIFMADGDAAIESMAGIEYGPSLYTKGPLSYEHNCSLVIFGPIGDEITMYTHGSELFNSSGDFPSGMLLKIGDGHEVFSGSGNLFILGPVPYSGEMSLYTRAGAFESIDLFTWGHDDRAGAISGFIKGPEFICSSGDFDYPLDSTLFTYPSGGQSPDLYIVGPQFICSSGTFAYPGDPSIFTTPSGGKSPDLYTLANQPINGTCPLYIGPLRSREGWTLYLKTEDNSINNTANLFTHGFIPTSGESGVVQAFGSISLYLEAVNANYPYTAGGTDTWTLFIKTQDGNLVGDEVWSMFLKADFTTPATCDLYTYGHASGESPHGNELSSSANFVCSVNPDDPTRLGFIPSDSHDDPWNLFLKCKPGHFGITSLYMSGAAPINYAASGNLFVEGLFGQKTGVASLYLMGISGMFDNGPGGLHLFLDASILVYNTSGNLYLHGY